MSFIVSAIGKASNWKGTIGLMQMHQIPWPTPGLTSAILIEILGGVCLLIGTFLYPTVLALFAYVALATAFIPLQDALKNQGRESAVPVIGSNIAILGGLVLVLALKGF
jgi:putative oxidoreductase